MTCVFVQPLPVLSSIPNLTHHRVTHRPGNPPPTHHTLPAHSSDQSRQPFHLHRLHPGPADQHDPSFYAWAAMAQITGRGCATHVAALVVTGQPGAYGNRIAGYTSYHRGVISSIILINTAIVNVSDSTKNSLAISLSLPDFSGQTLYLSYLTVDGAD